jgi:hypothetical protein
VSRAKNQEPRIKNQEPRQKDKRQKNQEPRVKSQESRIKNKEQRQKDKRTKSQDKSKKRLKLYNHQLNISSTQYFINLIFQYTKRQNKLHFKFSNQLIYRTCLGSWF